MTALDTEVLIVGAGPTGLSLALWLRQFGIGVRIVDKRSGPGETSRALAVQSRTLEFHRQIGIVDEVLAAGVRLDRLGVHTPDGLAAALDFSAFGENISRYAFAFALPQDIHERILIANLAKAGVTVEREIELEGFAETRDGVSVTLRKGGSSSVVHAAYMVGADGAHSSVRHGLGIGFPGGAYDQSFYVADVKAQGAITGNGMDVTLGMYGFAITMPVRQSGSIRLIGVVPKKHEANAEKLSFEAIRADVERDANVKVDAVNWFSTYRVHHRVAERFRLGRVFIAGDAAHIHSPAGGQGMNTGIGDAVNLAWKLAAVLQGRADESLLDSYEPERKSFAKVLVSSTDRAFRLVTSHSRFSGIWRRFVMPRLVAAILGTKRGARAFFRMVSQTGVHYRASGISQGTVRKLKGGDRLPYVAWNGSDNHGSLAALDWQVHVYGEPTLAFSAAMARIGIPLHTFPWTPAADAAGLARDAAYLVRPDGYMAVAATQDPALFQAYATDLALKPRKPASVVRQSRAA